MLLDHGFGLRNWELPRRLQRRQLLTGRAGRLQIFDVDGAVLLELILEIGGFGQGRIPGTVQDHFAIKRAVLVVSKFSSASELVLFVLILLMLERIIVATPLFLLVISSYGVHHPNNFFSKL